MRTVVTGGAGFIGSHLVDVLVARGDDVHVVDNLATGKRERVNEAAQLHVVDVSDHDALRSVVDEHGPFDRWFHLAAQADVRVSIDEPLRDATANVLGTISVLEAARLNDAPVVFASTGGAIYGEVEPPSDEQAREQPLSFYGAAKLAAEKYVEMHTRLYGLPHAIVRYANVFGPRQDPHGEAGVVAIFGGKVLGGETARIYGDGRQTRDYVYVGDVVEATIRAGEHAASAAETLAGDAAPEVPVFNVGTGVETSVLELWEQMQRVGEVDLGAELAPLRPGELQRSALDASRAREVLGVELATPLDRGLADTLEWMRTQG
jgi:UDP-glucose 4-epimerase